MSWIKKIRYEDASASLKKLYDRIKGPEDNVDNILLAHSLRPHSLVGHMTLYKNVLHNSNNTLPKWYLETLGVYVSLLNHCDYCVKHHAQGLKRCVNDDERFEEIIKHLESNEIQLFFQGKYLEGLLYAQKLTQQANSVSENDIERMKSSDLSDGEILEINQVVSYFNYANRTVLGLGVNTDGDIIGLSPNSNEDPDNWNHQ